MRPSFYVVFPMQGPDLGLIAAALDESLEVALVMNNEELGDHVLKLDSSGATAWQQRYPWSTQLGHVVADQAGNVTILGTMRDGTFAPKDVNAFAHQLTSRGAHRWLEHFATSESDSFDAAVANSTGEVLALLSTDASLTGTAPQPFSNVFVRFAADHALTAACFPGTCD